VRECTIEGENVALDLEGCKQDTIVIRVRAPSVLESCDSYDVCDLLEYKHQGFDYVSKIAEKIKNAP